MNDNLNTGTPGSLLRRTFGPSVQPPDGQGAGAQASDANPAEMFDQYFGPTIFAPWAHVLLQYALPRRGERVLDLACGTGTVARIAASAVGPRGSVVGLDINPGMLNVARSRPTRGGAQIEWLEGTATDLKFEDATFDLVLCQQGLQFFPDRAAAASEICRVLKPSGRAALNLWQALDRHPVFHALCKAEAHHLDVPMDEVASPWSFPDQEDLHALLSNAGFRQIEITAETLNVHLPSSERFVNLSLFAATAFMPGIDWDDEAMRARIIRNVSRDIEPVLERYRYGDTLTFPTTWNVAVAHVP